MATADIPVIDYTHKGGHVLESFILYECDGVYRLRSRRSGRLYGVTWHLESATWGVYVRPEGNLTGLHFFEDEVVHVARLPGK